MRARAMKVMKAKDKAPRIRVGSVETKVKMHSIINSSIVLFLCGPSYNCMSFIFLVILLLFGCLWMFSGTWSLEVGKSVSIEKQRTTQLMNKIGRKGDKELTKNM